MPVEVGDIVIPDAANDAAEREAVPGCVHPAGVCVSGEGSRERPKMMSSVIWPSGARSMIGQLGQSVTPCSPRLVERVRTLPGGVGH